MKKRNDKDWKLVKELTQKDIHKRTIRTLDLVVEDKPDATYINKLEPITNRGVKIYSYIVLRLLDDIKKLEKKVKDEN